jgi:flagellar hook-associated protein 1 FlgK
MSLAIALSNAVSGLQAAQAQMRAVSDNIANVNTPGYVRKVADTAQRVVVGAGAGVEVTGVHRVTDQYLQLASLTAGSDASRYDVTSQFLDNAQTLFGDPSGKGFFFNLPDDISSAFAAAANDPSSSLLRGQAVNTISNFLGEADRINGQIASLRTTVDQQLSDDVTKANGLLTQIDSLNSQIREARANGGDSTGSENIQDSLVSQLSTLMNVRVSARDGGGVTIRSAEGVELAGDGAAKLTYNRTDPTMGYITAQTAGANSGQQPITLSSGEMRGLLDMRDQKLTGISDQLGEYVGRVVQQLNAAHNASTADPPPSTLTGRNTGLDLPTALSGFSGTSTVAILDPAGAVQTQVAIDFTAGTMTVGAGAPVAFTPASFLATLNASLGANGSASFTNGALSISAAGGNGVAIDEGTSNKIGQGFSQFFGLNDLVRSSAFGNFDTGLSAGDANGFTPGGQITLRLSQPDGRPITDVTVTVPGAGAPLMSDLLNALNAPSGGVGLYGQFSLDAQGGLAFTGNPPLNAQLSVVTDNTQRGVGGPSISQLFGLGPGARMPRAGTFSIDPTIAADPTKLAFGTLDLSVAAGQPAVSPGDGRGAQALSQVGDQVTQFKAAGGLGNVSMTLSQYAAQFGGQVGRDAATAESQKEASAAVKTEADTRLQSVEGVNIDEELVALTTYQQAYNANARMISAAKELFDTLANLVQ